MTNENRPNLRASSHGPIPTDSAGPLLADASTLSGILLVYPDDAEAMIKCEPSAMDEELLASLRELTSRHPELGLGQLGWDAGPDRWPKTAAYLRSCGSRVVYALAPGSGPAQIAQCMTAMTGTPND